MLVVGEGDQPVTELKQGFDGCAALLVVHPPMGQVVKLQF